MSIYESSSDLWYDTFLRRGISRVPGVGAQPSCAFYGFNGGTGVVSVSSAGTTTNGVDTTLSGGNLYIQAGSGAATGVLSWIGVVANNQAFHLVNPKTEHWYCAIWGKYVGTKVNNQTRAVWCIQSGGTYYGLGVQPNTGTVYQFVAGATTISSTVTIDAAANTMRLFEFWHNPSTALVYIAVDEESPVSATDANLPTAAAAFQTRCDTGADLNTQRLTTAKALILTKRS